jgi:hypothetical protein
LIANAVQHTYNPWFEDQTAQVRLPPPPYLDTSNDALPSGRDVHTRLMDGTSAVAKHPGLDAARRKTRACYVLDGSNIFYYKDKKGEHYMVDRSSAMANALAEARGEYEKLTRQQKAAFPKLASGEPDLRGDVVVVSSLDTLEYTFTGKYFDPQPNDYLYETNSVDGEQIESVLGFREMLMYKQIEPIRAAGTLVSWAGIRVEPKHLTDKYEHGYDDYLSLQTANFMRRHKRYDVVVLVHDDAYKDRSRVATATINMFQRPDVRSDTQVHFYVFHESKWLLESHRDTLIDGQGTLPETLSKDVLNRSAARWQAGGGTIPGGYAKRYDTGPATSY